MTLTPTPYSSHSQVKSGDAETAQALLKVGKVHPGVNGDSAGLRYCRQAQMCETAVYVSVCVVNSLLEPSRVLLECACSQESSGRQRRFCEPQVRVVKSLLVTYVVKCVS